MDELLIEKRSGDMHLEFYKVGPTVWKVLISQYDWESDHLEVYFTDKAVAMQVFETICRYGIFDYADQAVSKKQAAEKIKKTSRLDRVCVSQDLRKANTGRVHKVQVEADRGRRAAV